MRRRHTILTDHAARVAAIAASDSANVCPPPAAPARLASVSPPDSENSRKQSGVSGVCQACTDFSEA